MVAVYSALLIGLALFFKYAIPFLLLLLIIAGISWLAISNQGRAFRLNRRKPKRFIGMVPEVTFEDVAGEDEAKSELLKMIDYLKNSQRYHDMAARTPRGMLLNGAPGTGKTLLVQAMAGEARMPLFRIRDLDYMDMFGKAGNELVQNLSRQIEKSKPCIVFFDDLDSIWHGNAPFSNSTDGRELTFNRFLANVDALLAENEVAVLAATSRVNLLDPALLSSERFERIIGLSFPVRHMREDILRIHTRRLNLASDVNLGLLSRTTIGFSGAELSKLCNEATLIATRNGKNQVTMADFEAALDKLLVEVTYSKLLDEHEQMLRAYHEAGRALIAWITPGVDPIKQVSILPNDSANNFSNGYSQNSYLNYRRTDLFNKLSVLMAGRAAEEIVFDEITTGSENELSEATHLARRMVTRWGMGVLGPMTIFKEKLKTGMVEGDTLACEVSEETASRIDHDIQQLLEKRQNVVCEVLNTERKKLDVIAKSLLEEETLDWAELSQILGSRTFNMEEMKSKDMVR